ncbi:MAG: AAA family ATPase [Magnetococcus sp. DMHC-1]|nr:AAA family ATPase [Magnetococcales bacterium]
MIEKQQDEFDMNDEETRNESSVKRISIKNIYLDPNNYRLIHEKDFVEVSDERIKDDTVARRTFRMLAGERNQNIQDLIDSFLANGYLPVDQIQVRELPEKGYVVVEGNRRIAALKHILHEHEQKYIDLGKLGIEIFSRIPVVLYNDAGELHHLTLMALKHISGNKKWKEWNQAKLLQRMHSKFFIGEEEICRRIGISKVELRRSLRALAFVEQYKKSDYGDQFDESKFPIFREVIKNSAMKDWLNWNDEIYSAGDTNHADIFFSLISREPISEEDDDGQVTYGEQYQEPAINKRDDIYTLSRLLTDRRAFDILVKTRNLQMAYQASDLVIQTQQDFLVESVSRDINTLGGLSIRGENLLSIENALGKLQSIIDRTRSTGLIGVEQKNIFHDRIDSHFTSLMIHDYKKLKNIRIDTLSRINIFAGINNTGKTTLLEAVYLLSHQNDFDGLLNIMRLRAKEAADRLDPEWFLEQIPDSIHISGKFDNQDTNISTLHYFEESPTFDKTRYMQTVELTANHGTHKQESLTRIFLGRQRETLADSIKLLCPVVFSSPFFLNEPHRYARFYHQSVQSKSLPQIIEFLRREMLPSINDIRLIDARQRFIVDDNKFDRGVDIAVYGEGLQRIFFLSLMFSAAKNGIVLIDEFENAIHAKLIARYTPFIHELAVTFNAQLFMTSHSKECIDAFIENSKNPEYYSFYALVENEEKIIVRYYDGQKFQKLLKAGNVDLRKAR